MSDWLNNDLSDYIDKKEKILIDARQNSTICRISGIISGLFLALFIVIFITVLSGFIASGVFLNPFLPAVCVFICGYPLFASLIYNSQRSKRYVLTNCGIYKITGLIFKEVKFVAYNRITDVSMSRGPIQRVIGVGSIGVGTASGNVVGSVSNGTGYVQSIDEISIDSVDNYKQIKDVIIKNRKK